MSLNQPRPILYLITSGATTADTSPASEEFSRLLNLIKTAVSAGVDLIQIREKRMNTRALCELTSRASELTNGSKTKLLVNDRADVASVARADGIHLTSQSLPPDVVRKTFGPGLLIGVSTHSISEAVYARDRGADFVVFGPVFETESKKAFGEPQGIEKLGDVAEKVAPFPVIAIGGITLENAGECFRAGAAGVAAIRLFGDAGGLLDVVNGIRSSG